MMEPCRCGAAGEHLPCEAEMTQEDGLCDACRAQICQDPLRRWVVEFREGRTLIKLDLP